MTKYTPNIGWWSGGVTSAVACKLMVELFGADKCRIIMIDTRNEHEDTYRFKQDCEHWYGIEIESIDGFNDKTQSIQDVWRQSNSLNVAKGAKCSSSLKRDVREKWQKWNLYDRQIFGFEFDKKEFNRANSMKMNYPKAKAYFPLLAFGYSKKDCIDIVESAGIKVPQSYHDGFGNNNCLKTGCVQGGIGYWQKMEREKPDTFDAMANMEHELTNSKGSPVTMLKDQSNSAKESGNVLVFLKPHPDYPNLKSLKDMPPCKVQPLMECNGYCGINDLNERNKTDLELNFQD